jgi:hypothetical protein
VNRRDFLRALIAAAPALASASAVLDLDRMLWVPGEKTIFLPPVVSIESKCNQFLAPDWVAQQAFLLFRRTWEEHHRRYNMAQAVYLSSTA